ncbi:hypothetical protein PT7_P005 (plasmid) [Pusillimonas sp. T7-7]|nr:hypothetical protein PT7_P005 [Pusillimonas sp. T7-7]
MISRQLCIPVLPGHPLASQATFQQFAWSSGHQISALAAFLFTQWACGYCNPAMPGYCCFTLAVALPKGVGEAMCVLNHSSIKDVNYSSTLNCNDANSGVCVA